MVATHCEHPPLNFFFLGVLIYSSSSSDLGNRLAYRNGVTTAITAPTGEGFLQGVSTAFSAGSTNALAKGAIVQDETALHITISFSLAPSVSTQIAALRFQLFESSLKHWVRVRKVSVAIYSFNSFHFILNQILIFYFLFNRVKSRLS